MAITIDPATRVISVPQGDLTLISGSLFEMDTDAFRLDVNTLLSSQPYIWLPDAYRHNTSVTVAGTTFARSIEIINGFSVLFTPDDGSFSVRLVGSNNNIFDKENGVLANTLNQVIPTNSAGLIVDKSDAVMAADIAFVREIMEGDEHGLAPSSVRYEKHRKGTTVVLIAKDVTRDGSGNVTDLVEPPP